uniref:Cilium assembly protein DZIP1 n=1 Tax=Ciona savignyi TaxID=51511 RepID=H2Z8K9_CIOSA
MPGQTMYSPSLHYSTGIDHSYELDENNLQNPMPAFHFRKRFGDINWRKISSIDVDRVARELDFVTLQENISTVAFCNVDAVSDLDPLFVKLFKLAQFTIEYLLHSQEYLQSVINDMESRVTTTNDEKAAVEAQLVEANAEITKLKQENKKRRKMIEQQQLIIEAGASSYYKCPHCEKAFMNASFLQGHIQRRHPGSISYIGDVIEHSKREQAKLSDNLKQLESDLQKEKDNFHHRLREAESEKLRWAEESRVEMNRWKEEEETKWKEELKAVKDSFLEDIEKLKDKEEEYRKTIGNLQETMEIRQSNLGELGDDVEVEKTKMKDYGGEDADFGGRSAMTNLDRLNR